MWSKDGIKQMDGSGADENVERENPQIFHIPTLAFYAQILSMKTTDWNNLKAKNLPRNII